MAERELIYDWNRRDSPFDWARARVDLNDETLRDGLQSPSVQDPPLEVKRRLLRLMAGLGVVAAGIGFPRGGPPRGERGGAPPPAKPHPKPAHFPHFVPPGV